MPHFFQRRDVFGNSPAIWVLCALIFLVPIAWTSLGHLRLDNDIESWLPPDDPSLKVLHWAHEQFPVGERVFVTWDGSSLGDPRVDRFLQAVQPVADSQGVKRGGSPYVAEVVEPRDVLRLLQQNDVSAHEAVRRLEGVILGGGPLRVRLTEAGRKLSRWRHLDNVAAELSQAIGVQVSYEPADPNLAFTAQVPGYTNATGEEIPPSEPAVLSPTGQLVEKGSVDHDLSLTWNSISVATPITDQVVAWLSEQKDGAGGEPLVESSFFIPGSPVAIAVTLSDAGLADKAEAIAALKAAAIESGVTADELKLGGSAVASSALNAQVAHAVWNPNFPLSQLHRRSVILTSALAGAILAMVMLRSLRLAVIVLAAGLYTVYMIVALVPATGASMNMVLVVMPTLLMVITLSGGVHVCNYWKHAASNDPATAVVQACRMAAWPCVMAAVTTSIGLASLCTSLLSPVRDFGLYSAIGTLLSIGMVLIGIPALLLLWPARPPHEAELDHPGWRAFGRMLTVRPTLQVTLSLLVTVAASAGLYYFRTETKVIRYFPDSSRIVQDYWFIENHLAGIVPVETIVKFDVDAQSQSNFLDRMEMVRQIQESMRQHPEITGCISLADFQPVAELPDENSMLANSRYHKRANVAEERIRSGEITGIEAFYHVADKAHDLVTAGDQQLNRAGDELWRITAQVNVMTDADYAVILDDLHKISQETLRLQPGAAHVVTGAVPLFLRTQQAVLDSLITSSFLAFGIILLIFIVQLKSIPAGIVAMIPNIVPITIVFGLISYAGIRIDIGTMITASIALGMAVDGTLHFLEWFKARLAAGQTRSEAITSSVMHCGPAIWQTSWMVGLSLLMLLPADLLLISRFGWLMAAMVFVAMLGDLILLPQILASPLGKLFEGKPSAPGSSPAGSISPRKSDTASAPHFDASAAAVRFSP